MSAQEVINPRTGEKFRILPPKKPRQQLEARFVNEWLMLKHPTALQWKRVRLGPLPKVELSRMFMVAGHWADAIIFENDTVYIVEAKLRNESAGIGQLLLYDSLFGKTPQFTQYKLFPRKLILLVWREIPNVREQTIKHDIVYEKYSPKWLIDEFNRPKEVK